VPDIPLAGCDNAMSRVCRSKLSSGSHNGFDFTQFQAYFDEHRRASAEHQLYDQRRSSLTATTVSDVSLDCASTLSHHAETTNTSQCLFTL